MLNNYQIITVTPSGRRRYLEILVKYLLQLRHIIDKHVFWINTNKEEDLDYINKIVDEYPHFFEKLEVKDDEIYGNDLNVGKFYKYCKDTESIYIKIDDDIVFMQLSKFENFLNFRINNPEFFLVSANVINNGISHFIYNKLGLYGLENTLQVNYEFNNDAWLYPEAAIYSFNKFKDVLYENNLEKFNFDRWILSDNEIFSINLISWFGKDFAEMDIWGHYDEPFLSWVYPARIQRKNCIYGGFLAVHYSYFTQRKVIDSKPEILDFFKQLSDNVQLKNPA